MKIDIAFDLDGVLADFDGHYIKLFDVPPHIDDARGELWSNIEKTPSFFADLPTIPPMVELFRCASNVPNNVTIRVITGRPRTDRLPFAERDKRKWVHNNLGSVETIVCLARDKQKHIVPGAISVLIDDRIDNIHRWEEAGGWGIHHTSAASTRAALENIFNIAEQRSTLLGETHCG
jgi:5'(3')-deoxyribonucleotidase